MLNADKGLHGTFLVKAAQGKTCQHGAIVEGGAAFVHAWEMKTESDGVGVTSDGRLQHRRWQRPQRAPPPAPSFDFTSSLVRETNSTWF